MDALAPINAILARGGEGVLAVISDVEGPSYRPLGATMAIFAAGDTYGNLSSGCIEADLAIHAMDAKAAGEMRILRYGLGSPFKDIELPCGGGLEITLLPRPALADLSALSMLGQKRQAATLRIDLETGALALLDRGDTSRASAALFIRFKPEITFVVFGKGPEASTFAGLADASGYGVTFASPDEATLHAVAALGCETLRLPAFGYPSGLAIDDRTAVLLFFHDHEWEPEILMGALETKAFYIGAQGSMRARDGRLAAMRALGVSEADLGRLHGPVGLIPSVRDPRTLAVSVLADVLAQAMEAPQ